MNFRFHLAKGHNMKRVASERKKTPHARVYMLIFMLL